MIHDKKVFSEWLINYLNSTQSDGDFSGDGKGAVTIGYDDGYYWEYTVVKLNSDGQSLDVDIEEGSSSGWIDMRSTEANVPIEMFRQYLLNRKWGNRDVDTIQLLSDGIYGIKGANITKDETEEEDY